MYALIMAGGSGTRLWPVSRKNQPKQLMKFVGKNTLLQATFRRLSKGFSSKDIFVATTKQYAPLVSRQIPKISKSRYSIEPEIKDRGPAIALAALIMYHQNPDSSFVTAWSDHYIKDEASYFQTLRDAESYLKIDEQAFITVGVKPTFPHTGFGYIHQGKPIRNHANLTVYKALSFKEKPDQKTAQRFVRSGHHLWNTGYFIVKTKTLLALYQKHLPEIYEQLENIRPYLGTKKQQTAIDKYYDLMPKADIEHGLIEKLDNVVVLPAAFDWADVGSWKVIKDVLSIEEENLIHGKVATHNTQKSLIYNYENKLVAVVGADDMVVINTKDALLIAPKNKSEEIKELIKKISTDHTLRKYL